MSEPLTVLFNDRETYDTIAALYLHWGAECTDECMKWIGKVAKDIVQGDDIWESRKNIVNAFHEYDKNIGACTNEGWYMSWVSGKYEWADGAKEEYDEMLKFVRGNNLYEGQDRTEGLIMLTQSAIDFAELNSCDSRTIFIKKGDK